MLAKMSGRDSSSEHIGYALKAYFSVVRLIQLGIENALHAMKEIAKSNAAANETDKVAGENKKKQTESGKKSNLGEKDDEDFVFRIIQVLFCVYVYISFQDR